MVSCNKGECSMNKIYKIVWSKAKHAYVVTSEVARSHTKSASGKAVKAALAAAVGMGVLMGGYAADRACSSFQKLFPHFSRSGRRFPKLPHSSVSPGSR